LTSVIVDTSALYALLVRSDESHEPAIRIFRALIDETFSFDSDFETTGFRRIPDPGA
jgi:predicted nucleic acid-binding protein